MHCVRARVVGKGERGGKAGRESPRDKANMFVLATLSYTFPFELREATGNAPKSANPPFEALSAFDLSPKVIPFLSFFLVISTII